MKIWLGKVFACSQRADVLCTEVHKRMERVRGGERVDSCEKELYTQQSCCFYVAAMKVNCLRVIIPPILFKRVS
jgi:hypothetical protein